METFILFFLFFFLQSQKANKYRTFKNRFINLFWFKQLSCLYKYSKILLNRPLYILLRWNTGWLYDWNYNRFSIHVCKILINIRLAKTPAYPMNNCQARSMNFFCNIISPCLFYYCLNILKIKNKKNDIHLTCLFKE